MTQKEKVLRMLKDAGEQGVRSDAFYKDFNGRGVARIYDLRKEGHEITDEREGKYKRYRLIQDHHGPGGETGGVTSGKYSQEERAAESRRASAGGPERSVPSMFDYDADWGGA